MYNDNASKIWLELKEHFSHANSVHFFQVDQEIYECIQGGMSIGDYYTTLKGLWDVHDALNPFPSTNGDVAEQLQEY